MPTSVNTYNNRDYDLTEVLKHTKTMNILTAANLDKRTLIG